MMKSNLIDQLWPFIHPITLGKGKKLFVDGAITATFDLIESVATANGLIMGNFKHARVVKSGTNGVLVL